jgi:hypothetical protein
LIRSSNHHRTRRSCGHGTEDWIRISIAVGDCSIGRRQRRHGGRDVRTLLRMRACGRGRVVAWLPGDARGPAAAVVLPTRRRRASRWSRLVEGYPAVAFRSGPRRSVLLRSGGCWWPGLHAARVRQVSITEHEIRTARAAPLHTRTCTMPVTSARRYVCAAYVYIRYDWWGQPS